MKTTLRLTLCLALIAFLSATVWGQTTQPTDEQMSSGPAPKGKPWEPAWGFWKDAPTSWLPTHRGFVKKAQKGGFDVLFLGDSITNGWSGAGKTIFAEHYEPLKALNIGIGGDTTRQTLWRIDHDALSGIEPKVVVLMIGVNNIFTGTGNDEEIARGIEEVTKQILAKRPKSKILLQSILPQGNKANTERSKNINAMIAKLANEQIRYLDLTSTFQDADGNLNESLYRNDKVHLSTEGYAAWDAVLRPVLLEMLK